MNVDIANRLQLGNFAEVVIVGEEFGPEIACQADQLGVHFLLQFAELLLLLGGELQNILEETR